MNPDTPQTPREEIEVRLTALLMGELAPDEAAAVQSLIAADPALAALHSRLARAVELLREASALPEHPAPPVPAQLSSEKRERLLAHFKTPAPAPSAVIVKPKRNWKWTVPLGIAAIVIALIGVLPIQLWQMHSLLAGSGISDPRAIQPRPPLSWFVRGHDEGNVSGRYAADGTVNQVIGQIRDVTEIDARKRAYRDLVAKGLVSRTDVSPDEETVSETGGQEMSSERGNSAGGGRGAVANATQWMFKKSTEPESPIVGRTAFWSDDAASKVNISTASGGTFWDTSAPQPGLGNALIIDQAPSVLPPARDINAYGPAPCRSTRHRPEGS